MIVIDIDVMDGKGSIPVAIRDFMEAHRINTYVADAKKAFSNESKLAAMTRWLEANQPDVFKRGLWDAINDA